MAELGTRQQCRDNVTMFSGHKTVSYCIMPIFVVAIPFRRRHLKLFRIFSCLLSSITLSRCRCSRCRVPSSSGVERSCFLDWSRTRSEETAPAQPVLINKQNLSIVNLCQHFCYLILLF